MEKVNWFIHPPSSPVIPRNVFHGFRTEAIIIKLSCWIPEWDQLKLRVWSNNLDLGLPLSLLLLGLKNSPFWFYPTIFQSVEPELWRNISSIWSHTLFSSHVTPGNASKESSFWSIVFTIIIFQLLCNFYYHRHEQQIESIEIHQPLLSWRAKTGASTLRYLKPRLLNDNNNQETERSFKTILRAPKLYFNC